MDPVSEIVGSQRELILIARSWVGSPHLASVLITLRCHGLPAVRASGVEPHIPGSNSAAGIQNVLLRRVHDFVSAGSDSSRSFLQRGPAYEGDLIP